MLTPYEAASTALRKHSANDLQSGLIAYMRASEPVEDWRDVLVGFAPFHDCARRLQLDPAALFDEAAEVVGGETAELARTFGRRSDVTPRAFDYSLVEGPDGPSYRVGQVRAPSP